MKNESEQNKNELKASDLETYQLKTKERTKNDKELPQNCSRKCLGSVTEAPRLGFFSFFLFSH